MPDNEKILSRYLNSARYTDPPPGTCPEDYDNDDDFEEDDDDGVDPGYDGILGEG